MKFYTKEWYMMMQKPTPENHRVWQEINAQAKAVLDKQNLPAELRSRFRFHDADVLRIRKHRGTGEMYLREEGFSEDMPYTRILFKGVSHWDREKGFTLPLTINEDGLPDSDCFYLYDEIYRIENGYEIHILFDTHLGKTLRCLTVRCQDIVIESTARME